MGRWIHVVFVAGMVAALVAAPVLPGTSGVSTADTAPSVGGATTTAEAGTANGTDTGDRDANRTSGTANGTADAAGPSQFWSAPPDPQPETKTQPDGTTFEARQWGNAFRNGWETTDNYTIRQNESGWWHYVREDDGRLVATDRLAGVDSPAGLPEHARPEQMRPTAPQTEDGGPSGAPTEPTLSSAASDSGAGDVTLPVVLADFSDLEHTYSADSFADQFFGTNPPEATGPGSLREYYLEVSDGLVNLTAGPGVVGWVDTDMTHDEAGKNYSQHREFALEAIAQADETTDFSTYDDDGDGVINVAVVYPGDTANDSDIWPHQWYADYQTDDGVTVESYSLQNEMTEDGRQNSIGTMAHETGHLLFDWPDLYQPDDASIGLAGLMGTGSYGVEDDDDAVAGDSPTHPTVPNKEAAGWATTTRVAPSDQPGILPRASQVNDFYQVGADSAAKQFLLAYRDTEGFDLRVDRYGTYTDLEPGLFVWDSSTEWSKQSDGTDLDLTMAADGESFTGECPGCDGTVRLQNVTRTHDSVLFNDPPRRTLAADGSAVYAVPVNTTLPDGRTIGDAWRLSSRVSWADNDSDLDLSLTSPDGNRTYTSAATETSYAATRTAGTPESGGWKLVQRTGDAGVDYYSATTYPTLPLPTAVSANATDADAGNAAAPDTVTVNVSVFTGGQPYETGTFEQLNASSFTVTVGGETVTAENVSVTTPSTGAYTLTIAPPERSAGGTADLAVTVTDTKVGVTHTTNTSTTTVRYDDPDAVPDAAASANRTTVTTGEAVAFDASNSTGTDGSIASYEWVFGDGANATGERARHAFASTGNYTVNVTVTDNDGATDTASVGVAVTEPNAAPDASASANRTNVTAGEAVAFDARQSADTDGSIASYEWTFDDGANATGNRTSHTFHSNGTYTVELTVTDDDGATDNTTVTVEVGEPNAAPDAYASANRTNVTAGEGVAFDASNSTDTDGSMAGYEWAFGDGANATGERVSHAFASNGTHTVELTVTDDDGATDNTTLTVEVTEPNAAPDAAVSANRTNVTAGEAVAFDASNSTDTDGSIASYEWAFGDGATANGTQTTHVFATNGSYTVELTVTDDDGATDTATVTVNVTDDGSAANTTDGDGGSTDDGDGGSTDDGSTGGGTGGLGGGTTAGDSDDTDADTPTNDSDTADETGGNVSVTVGDADPTTGEMVNVTVNVSDVNPENDSMMVVWARDNQTVDRTAIEVDSSDSSTVTLSRSFSNAGEYEVQFANRTAEAISVDRANTSEPQVQAQSPAVQSTATAQSTPSPTAAPGTATNDTDTPSTTGGSGPGFGVVGTLVAVLLVFWRRQ